MKSQWDVRIDTIWEGSPGLFHFPSPTPPLLSPPPQSQLLVKEPSWVGGWCTQSIWMLPFQLLYYWAVSPALLLPFICRQDLVKLFRMVLNSLNTKGEFSTFYHLSSASRVAGTSEMYHYAQQILCFKLFTVFETKIQKKKQKMNAAFHALFPGCLHPDLQDSEVTLPVLTWKIGTIMEWYWQGIIFLPLLLCLHFSLTQCSPILCKMPENACFLFFRKMKKPYYRKELSPHSCQRRGHENGI